ncbi:MAG: hypothetical protein ACI81R_001780, partial [Bradymonadia bacterium]
MDPDRPALAPAYKSIIADSSADGGVLWLGEAGFIVGAANDNDETIWEHLAHQRWLGMHPDLVPFARDGWGNRFCFLRPSDTRRPGDSVIMYWMYETFVAIPIASSFEAFLRWIGLITWAHSVDPSYDSVEQSDYDGFLRIVEPHLTLPQFSSLVPTRVAERRVVAQAGLKLDPRSPSLLVHRAASRDADDQVAALLDCDNALQHFPQFTAAHVMKALLLRKERGSVERLNALRASLESPLAFTGDKTMPWFRDVPSIDCDRIAEALSSHPRLHDLCNGDPIMLLVQRLDPSAPMSWVELTLAQVDSGDLHAAVVMATNALHCAVDDAAAREEVERLLVQLYDAIGAHWHAS